MKARDSFIACYHLLPADAEVLTDTDEDFSFAYTAGDGQRVICGWNPTVHTWWRNGPHGRDDVMRIK